MEGNISKLKAYFKELFGDTYLENCLVEVEDKENELVLSANIEGMLLLIEEMVNLCELNEEWGHYHLDEAGMARKCNKPVVISLVKKHN